MQDIEKHLGVLLLAFGAMSPATAPASRASTHADENRKLVVAFYERFFNPGAADRYIGEVCIQPNPNMRNGREAFWKALTRVIAQFPQRHSQIVRAIAEGDLVVLHVQAY